MSTQLGVTSFFTVRLQVQNPGPMQHFASVESHWCMIMSVLTLSDSLPKS